MTEAAASVGLEALPPATQAPLRALKESLEAALGANLSALLVYGSAVRGGYVPGESDIDVVIVLQDTSLPHLLAMAEPLRQARFGGRVEAIIMKRENIPRASDVFPLLYDDLRQRNVVLSGTSPFTTLEISDAHRRLRVEQELCEARIRMRRAVVDAMGSEANIAGVVARKVKQIRSPLHALLGLKGIPTDDRLEPVFTAAGKAYGIDTTALLQVAKSPEAAHAAFRSLLDAAIEDADRLEVGGRS